MGDNRHRNLLSRIHNAQIHAGEQEVLAHLCEIEGRPNPEPPKTYNDGLEAAAFNIEKEAKLYSASNSTLAYATKDVQAILIGAGRRIRALKEPTNE